jgi:curved DNA-binding protein CbpA
MADYYEILGVPRDASTAVIRTAYARQARDGHPDRFSDAQAKRQAEETFKTITTAFNTLSNERLRREYDAELAHPMPTTPAETAAEAFAAGQAHMEARDHERARTLFRIAAHNVPGEARYHLALGRALARDPRSAREAIEALETAARLAPNDLAAHLDLARVLHAQGLRLRASRAAETVARMAPNDPQVRRLLAEIGARPEGEEAGDKSGGLLGRLRRKP